MFLNPTAAAAVASCRRRSCRRGSSYRLDLARIQILCGYDDFHAIVGVKGDPRAIVAESGERNTPPRGALDAGCRKRASFADREGTAACAYHAADGRAAHSASPVAGLSRNSRDLARNRSGQCSVRFPRASVQAPLSSPLRIGDFDIFRRQAFDLAHGGFSAVDNGSASGTVGAS